MYVCLSTSKKESLASPVTRSPVSSGQMHYLRAGKVCTSAVVCLVLGYKRTMCLCGVRYDVSGLLTEYYVTLSF